MNSESYSPPLGVDGRRRDEVLADLLDGDADLPHLGRQPAERLVDAVLHVDGGDVGIARDVERDGDRG